MCVCRQKQAVIQPERLPPVVQAVITAADGEESHTED